jgi:NAD(P)H-dependent glutamate synthase small subunit
MNISTKKILGNVLLKSKFLPIRAGCSTGTSVSPASSLNKTRGFIQYERDPLGYRPTSERLEDWNEINKLPEDRDPYERRKQAARCMDCGTPYCNTYQGCPISNPIPKFNTLVYEDQWKKAAKELLKTNPFPEFTGRVCPAPCEGSCIAGIVENPVTIKDIEYAIIDRAFREGWIKPRVPKARSGRTVAIVGSGPAGLAAADRLNQQGHQVIVYERASEIGGLLYYGIPNMKLDKRTVERRIDLLKQEGIEFKTNTNVGINVAEDSSTNNTKQITTSSLREKYDSVVLTIGSTQPRELNIPGSELKGIISAMEFLTENQKGLKYQKKKDRLYDENGWSKNSDPVVSLNNVALSLVHEKNVVVIGGGDTGTDCIGTCVRHGASSVINLELLPKPPSERSIDNPWPEWPRVFSMDYGHTESAHKYGHGDPRSFGVISKSLIADEETGTKIVGIEVASVNMTENGPIEIDGTTKIIPADVIITAMGFVSPEQNIINELNLAIDAKKNILTVQQNGNNQFNVLSNINGAPLNDVFAGGDCRRGQSLVVWAINEGLSLAKSVEKYLLRLNNMKEYVPTQQEVVGL